MFVFVLFNSFDEANGDLCENGPTGDTLADDRQCGCMIQ